MNLRVSFSLGVKEEYFSTLFLTKRFCSKIVLNKFIEPLKLVAIKINLCNKNNLIGKKSKNFLKHMLKYLKISGVYLR